jgi:hypothetical protein
MVNFDHVQAHFDQPTVHFWGRSKFGDDPRRYHLLDRAIRQTIG